MSVSHRSVVCFSLQFKVLIHLLSNKIAMFCSSSNNCWLLQIWSQEQRYRAKYRCSPFLWKRRRHMSICPKWPQCKICWRNTQSQDLVWLFNSRESYHAWSIRFYHLQTLTFSLKDLFWKEGGELGYANLPVCAFFSANLLICQYFCLTPKLQIPHIVTCNFAQIL